MHNLSLISFFKFANHIDDKLILDSFHLKLTTRIYLTIIIITVLVYQFKTDLHPTSLYRNNAALLVTWLTKAPFLHVVVDMQLTKNVRTIGRI